MYHFTVELKNMAERLLGVSDKKGRTRQENESELKKVQMDIFCPGTCESTEGLLCIRLEIGDLYLFRGLFYKCRYSGPEDATRHACVKC